ncbi:WW domain-containing oxidoreductase [Daldinia childiae]|uniref:WW domain-containing oxidoreductase n=1 Tax=Daldinia childiae TaxID=326645 RepID=UPI001444C9E1|nr:WW domain-containing oxidoreductase [Daldinia childiae]KAF3055800.1 WW domain-containing oxidoreductase [Daldinia childiae]
MATSKDLPPLDVGFGSIFMKNQFRTKPQHPPSTIDLTGKVALITGANTGLGYESSKQMLALHLSHLIIAVRSQAKGDAAASKLRTLYPKAKIEVMIVDMGKYSSIQEFAQRVDSTLPRLDIAILNAGVIKLKYTTEPSTGHEQILQVNYLSTIFLAILLLPILKRTSPPGTPGRLTIVNAALALTAPLPKAAGHKSIIATLDDPKFFAPNTDKNYNMSKVLAQMFAYKLSEYVSADDVIVNLVCPGFVKGTELSRDASIIIRPAMALFSALAARTVKDGASTYLDAALVKGKESHCSFLMSWKVSPFNSFLYTSEGKDAADQLFDETMKELEFANVRSILESMRSGTA